MRKEVLYTYLGTNGTLTSPIHLEGIYYVRKIKLTPEEGKMLTKDGLTFRYSVTVPEQEVNDWTEVTYVTGQE